MSMKKSISVLFAALLAGTTSLAFAHSESRASPFARQFAEIQTRSSESPRLTTHCAADSLE